MTNQRNIARRRRLRSAALTMAILGALTVAPAGAATAPELQYQLSTSAWTQGLSLSGFLTSVDNGQVLGADVTAMLPAGAEVLITGGILDASLTNSNNLVHAGTTDAVTGLRGANGASNTVDLALLGTDGEGMGIGVLSGQLATDAMIRAGGEDARITTPLAGFVTGKIDQSGNAIGADALVNGASNAVAGSLPVAFDGSAPGTLAYAYGAPALPTVAATGDVVISNMQSASGINPGLETTPSVASSASLQSASVALVDTGAASQPLDVDAVVDGNKVATSFAVNAATNRFDAAAGSTFDGAVLIANGQNNIASGDAGDAAATIDSGVTASLQGSLSGSLSASDNQVDAAASGNAADNSIRFADGISVGGDGATAKLTVNGTSRINAEADLGVVNSQRNAGGELNAAVENGFVIATASHLTADGGITMDGDSIGATSSGNSAANSISASGATFGSTIAAGNQQANIGVGINARVEGGTIVAGVFGDAGNAVGGLDDVSAGTIAVSGSRVSADAAGNKATTDVRAEAASFDIYDRADNMHPSSRNLGLGTIGTAGIGVVSLQNNTGAVDASVGSGTSVLGPGGGWIGAYYNGGVSGGIASVSGNGVQATAGANDATTTTVAGGSDGHLNAQTASTQLASGQATATVDSARIGTYIGGGSATQSGLSVIDNAIAAKASANHAVTAIAVDFDHLGVGQPAANQWNNPTNVIDTALEENTSTAVFALGANQKSSGTVDATVSGAFTGLEIGDHPWPGVSGSEPQRGNITGGSASVAGNAISASAQANVAGNRLLVDAGSLTTDSGASEQIAALGNYQASGGTTTATVAATGADVRDIEEVGVIAHRDLQDAAVNVGDNTLTAFGSANMADNTLALTGGAYAETPAAAGNSGFVSADAMSVYAGLALQSRQDASGSVAVAVDNGNLGVGLTDGAPLDRHDVADSAIVVTGNAVSADARDNYASNKLGIGMSYDAAGNASVAPMTELDTTAGLQNIQESGGSVLAQANGLVGLVAGHYDVAGTDISVSGNGVTARAVANTAGNRMDVAATTLAGDSIRDGGAYPYRGALSGSGTEALADYAMANTQSQSGILVAGLDNVDGDGTGIGVGIGEGRLDGGSISIADNSQAAFAQANSAANSLSLQGAQIEASAAVSNDQSASGMALATGGNAAVPGYEGALGFAVQVNGSVGAYQVVPVAVTGNTMFAGAGFNEATNRVTATADGAVAGSVGPAIAFGGGDGAATGAYFSLSSTQSAAGAVVASAEPGLVGMEVVGMEANGISSTIGNVDERSNISVGDNQVASQATANRADNAIGIEGSTIGATAALANGQDAIGSASALLSGVSVGLYNRDSGQPAGGKLSNVDVSVGGNALGATSTANSALNVVSVASNALNAAPATLTAAGTAMDGGVALANYAVLNVQVSEASSSASLGNSSIGLNADTGMAVPHGSAAPMLNGSVAIAGNQATASATANSASSAILLSSMGTPSAALVNNQLSLGQVTASVSDMRIGVAVGSTTGASVAVTGNVVGAGASANSAINHIGISD